MAKVHENSRLTFIKQTSKGKHGKGLYRCICGIEKEIIRYCVDSGIVLSCGCLHREKHFKHGLINHPLYSTWANIKDRCYNENSKRYYTAGERGITMCDEWLNNFQAFYDWCMANGWKKGKQVDKDLIPLKLGIPALIYSPAMCSIVTCQENNNAKSNSFFIEYNGKKQTLTQWSRDYNLDARTLRSRIMRNGGIFNGEMLKPARNNKAKT
jgi:hypothetical protein